MHSKVGFQPDCSACRVIALPKTSKDLHLRRALSPLPSTPISSLDKIKMFLVYVRFVILNSNSETLVYVVIRHVHATLQALHISSIHCRNSVQNFKRCTHPPAPDDAHHHLAFSSRLGCEKSLRCGPVCCGSSVAGVFFFEFFFVTLCVFIYTADRVQFLIF